MGQHDSKSKTGPDYAALADGVDDLREVLRAMVAGVVGDGFSDEQARAIVAGFFSAMIKKQEVD